MCWCYVVGWCSVCGSMALDNDSVAYLAKLPVLETLDISWCRNLNDPEPLASCQCLRTLISSGTRLRSDSLLRLRSAVTGDLKVID